MQNDYSSTNPNDIENIKNFCIKNGCDLNNLIDVCKNTYSLPTVRLTGNKAIISHCWFDNWNGLTQVTWQGEYYEKKKQIKQFELIEEKVLVKYRCKFYF